MHSAVVMCAKICNLLKFCCTELVFVCNNWWMCKKKQKRNESEIFALRKNNLPIDNYSPNSLIAKKLRNLSS